MREREKRKFYGCGPVGLILLEMSSENRVPLRVPLLTGEISNMELDTESFLQGEEGILKDLMCSLVRFPNWFLGRKWSNWCIVGRWKSLI